MEKMKPSDGFRTLPDRVKQFYYKIGLVCSSYPYVILVLTTLVILISCYPLLHLPLPGSKPLEFTTILQNADDDGDSKAEKFHEELEWPRWLQQHKDPVLFIQQIVVKSYQNQNVNQSNDAVRQSFRHVFHILDELQNIPGLASNCFPAQGIKSKLLKEKYMLPENKCLIVSPANFWHEDVNKFERDDNIIRTILKYQSYEKGRSGLAEILLGMSVGETGLKSRPFSRRVTAYGTLSYAVTIVLKQRDDRIMQALKRVLSEGYDVKISNKTSYVYYPPNKNYIEIIPLAATYTILFVYIYFSVKKIDIIYSKLGVAFSALLTIIASLCTSIGICNTFVTTMNFSINNRTIFPYLIGIVGLENVLVMTRSVVSTNVNLDVKIRFAQGLSKEGWSITKNLLTEVTILTVGFFTFFPRIQEFCILAIVGLLSDFFLQTFFYGTILSMDIRRGGITTHRYAQPLRTPVHPESAGNSAGLLVNHSPKNSNPGVVVAPTAPRYIEKIPKRLRLVYFWAKTRFFQRTFMIVMIGWISVIIYEVISVNIMMLDSELDIVLPKNGVNSVKNVTTRDILNSGNNSTTAGAISGFYPGHNFEFEDYGNSGAERSNYWQSLVSIYNVSVMGKCLQILPPMTLHADPRNMFSVNNKFNWELVSNINRQFPTPFEYLGPHNSIAASKSSSLYAFEDPYIPSSPIELLLTMLIAIPSVIFISYSLVVLYRCVCSRNYAEWRSSWNASGDKDSDTYTQVLFEAVPLVLNGHAQEVECIGCDGSTIASVCLNGVLKVWNMNAENIVCVDRKRYFEGTDNEESESESESIKAKEVKKTKMSKQPVWSLDINSRIIVLGTGTGRLEVWDCFTGSLKGTFDEGGKSGITCTKIIGTRVAVARLNGSLDFLLLESADCTRSNGHTAAQMSNPYHRYNGIEDSRSNKGAKVSALLNGEEVRCIWLTTLRAHQQPITCLESEGGRVVTGSQDHSLKVFRLHDTSHMYTLHGHYGPITCLFIDKDSPMTSGSGSQDGMVCVWDLMTGTCMYAIQAHDGPVTGLTYSASYVISVGGDDKICVLERFQGNVLNTIQLDHAYSSSLVMLTHNLLITSKQGSLVVWDVQSGEPIRSVRLGHRDNTVFVRQIINCGGAVLCDYGAQLRLVRFPSIVNKFE